MMILWGALVSAQELPPELDYTIDVEQFRPHGDHYGYVVTEGAFTLKHLQVGVGFWLNFSTDPVNFYLAGGRAQLHEGDLANAPAPDVGDGVIDKRSMSDLQVSLGLFDRVSLSLNAPVLLWQEGFEPASAHFPETFDEELVSSGPNDFRITPKVIIADRDTVPVGIALSVPVTIPNGARRSFLGEGEPTFLPTAIFEFSDGPIHGREYHVRGALNVGYKVRTAARYQDVVFGNELVYRAGLGVHPTPALEFGADLVGSTSGPDLTHKPLEVLPWIQLEAKDLVTLNFGGGFGLLPGLGTPDWRVFGGATLAPSFNPDDLDRDGDGIPNHLDDCKNIPEDFDGFEDEDGCPEDDNDQDGLLDVDDACPLHAEDFDGFQDEDGCPDDDNDKDGIPDVRDACPNKPENRNGFQDDDGCPDAPPPKDTDGDGYVDEYDRCPYEPEDFDDWEDRDGCPEPDNDMDGIADRIDRCPNVPEDFDGVEDDDGCPDTDDDGDGILEPEDLCPREPENFNGYQDFDGCPDTPPPKLVVIEKTHIVIHDKIYFEVDKAIIRPVSFPLLDEIARVLLDNPKLLVVQVEGHTDSDGDDAYNLDLSRRRAESVRDYLVRAGVEEGRLLARGFGELMPIAPNTNAEGKAANRRVEFRIMEREK